MPELRLLSCEAARRAVYEALGAARLPEAVARHLQVCEDCACDASDLKLLVGTLRGIPVEEPPPSFWEALPGRVREQAQTPHVRPSWAWSALAAAALLLLTIVPAAQDHRTRPTASVAVAALAATESWPESLDAVRSPGEMARVAQEVAAPTGLASIQQGFQVVETVRWPEASVWDLLDSMSPEELERLVAGLERGA